MARRRRLPNFLREPEMLTLLQVSQQMIDLSQTSSPRRHKRQRNHLALLLGLFLGLRVSEICKLKIEDLDLDKATCFVHQGKGDRDRIVPIPARIVEPLRAWIAGRTEGVLLGLTIRTAQVAIEQLGRKANLPRRLKPHTLRHTFATRLLEKGASIREVQELLGHASVATTEIYTHTAPDRLRSAVERL